jgi:hypothetical protein
VPPCGGASDVFGFSLTDGSDNTTTSNLTVSIDVSCETEP